MHTINASPLHALSHLGSGLLCTPPNAYSINTNKHYHKLPERKRHKIELGAQLTFKHLGRLCPKPPREKPSAKKPCKRKNYWENPTKRKNQLDTTAHHKPIIVHTPHTHKKKFAYIHMYILHYILKLSASVLLVLFQQPPHPLPFNICSLGSSATSALQLRKTQQYPVPAHQLGYRDGKGQ